MNYFEFYGIKTTFFPDVKEVRTQFLKKSREYHPDFHSDKSQEGIRQLEHWSAYNNEAYHTLIDFNKLIVYLLQWYDGKFTPSILDTTFLMDMMEMNEAIETALEHHDTGSLEAMELQIKQLQDTAQAALQPHLQAFESEKTSLESTLTWVHEYHQKEQYFNRMHQLLRNEESEL